MNTEEKYVGFWVRTAATIIDWIWMYGIVYAVLFMFVTDSIDTYSLARLTIEWLIPFMVVMAFWRYKQATPGKMLFGMRIVDATTSGEVSTTRLVIRYLAYFISMLPLGLGFIWAAFDKRKQGWHDKIAGTVIIRLVQA